MTIIFQTIIRSLLILAFLAFYYSKGISQTLSSNLHMDNPSLEFPDAELFAKAASPLRDFSEEEMRKLINYHCVATCGLDEQWHIVMYKINDLGASIQPLLCKMALEYMDDHRVSAIVGCFKKNDEDSSEMRSITLKFIETHKGRKGIGPFFTGCRVLADIGEPEDVPKLLSFIGEDPYVFYALLEAVGKIAAVSQIPDIEKAIAEWEKIRPTDNDDWQNRRQAEIKRHIDNIRERNVQWTPPSAPKNNDRKKNEGADEASPTTTFSYWFFLAVIVTLIFGGTAWGIRGVLCGGLTNVRGPEKREPDGPQ